MSNWNQVVDVVDVLGDAFGVATSKLLELGGLTTGSQVLDLGCGAGGLAIHAFKRVKGNGGRVVAVDACEEMIQSAQARYAGQEGLQFVAADASTLSPWGEIFDTTLCRFSLPSMADPSAALKACHDTLKPGGRVCVMAVGGHERNEFFTLLGQLGGAVLAQTLESGKPVAVAHQLEEAGFVQVATKEIRALVTISDPNAYWTALRGLLAIPNQAIPPQLAQAVPPGTKLNVALVFAMGVKRDPNAPDALKAKTFDEYVGSKKSSIREINPMGVKTEFKKVKLKYIDVRDPDSVASSIRDSISITRDKLELEAPGHIPEYDTVIVTYCATGSQGALAAAQLEEMGYTNVWNLQGGFDSWEHNGMPTV